MTSKEQLIHELETLPEQLIDEVLDYIGFIKNRPPKKLKKVSFTEDWWDNLLGASMVLKLTKNLPLFGNGE